MVKSLISEVFKNAFYVSPVPLIITDKDGLITELSQSAEKLLNLPRNAIITSTTIYALIGSEDIKENEKRIIEINNTKYEVKSEKYTIEDIDFKLYVFTIIHEIKQGNPKIELIEQLLSKSYKIRNFHKFVQVNLEQIASHINKSDAAAFFALSKDNVKFTPVAFEGFEKGIPKRMVLSIGGDTPLSPALPVIYNSTNIPKTLGALSIIMQWYELKTLLILPIASNGKDVDSMFILFYKNKFEPDTDNLATLKLLALVFSIVHNRANLQAEIAQNTYKDFITRAYSQIMLKEFVQLIFSQAKRYNFAFAIVIFKILNYNELKNSYGTKVLEKMMQKISGAMLKTLRKSDVVGRYTEDSFLSILPFTQNGGVEIAIRRVRDALNLIDLSPVKGLKIGAGVAHLEDYDVEASSLLQRAKTTIQSVEKI